MSAPRGSTVAPSPHSHNAAQHKHRAIQAIQMASTATFNARLTALNEAVSATKEAVFDVSVEPRDARPATCTPKVMIDNGI